MFRGNDVSKEPKNPEKNSSERVETQKTKLEKRGRPPAEVQNDTPKKKDVLSDKPAPQKTVRRKETPTHKDVAAADKLKQKVVPERKGEPQTLQERKPPSSLAERRERRAEAREKKNFEAENKKLDDDLAKVKQVHKDANGANNQTLEKQKLYTQEYAQQVGKVEQKLDQTIETIDKRLGQLDRHIPAEREEWNSLRSLRDDRMAECEEVRAIAEDIRQSQIEKGLQDLDKPAEETDKGEKQDSENFEKTANDTEKAILESKDYLEEKLDKMPRNDPHYQETERKLAQRDDQLEQIRNARIEKGIAEMDQMDKKISDADKPDVKKEKVHSAQSEKSLQKTADTIKESRDAMQKQLYKLEQKNLKQDDPKTAELRDKIKTRDEQLAMVQGKTEEVRDTRIQSGLKKLKAREGKENFNKDPEQKLQKLQSGDIGKKLQETKAATMASIEYLNKEKSRLNPEKDEDQSRIKQIDSKLLERAGQLEELEKYGLDRAQSILEKAHDSLKEDGLEKKYREELFFQKDGQKIEILEKGLEAQKDALTERSAVLEGKMQELEKQKKTETQEYKDLMSEDSQRKKDLGKVNARLEEIRDMKIQKGLQTGDEIGQKAAENKLNMSQKELHIAEQYLKNAITAVDEKVADLEKQKTELDPRKPEDERKREQIDEDIAFYNGGRSFLEAQLYIHVSNALTDIDMKDLEKAQPNTEELSTEKFRSKFSRTYKRVEETLAYMRAEEGAEAKPIPSQLKQSLRTETRKEYEESKANLAGLATVESNKLLELNKIKDFLPKEVPTPEKSKMQQLNDQTKAALNVVDAGFSVAKMAKDRLYGSGEVKEYIKNADDLVSKVEKMLKERFPDMDSKESVEKAGKILSEAKDLTASVSEKDKAEKMAAKALLRLLGKMDPKNEFEKKHFDNIASTLSDITDLKEIITKPFAIKKNVAKALNTPASLAEHVKTGMEGLLEARYGKDFGAGTDFISKTDELIYELVKDQPNLAAVDFIKRTISSVAHGTEAMEGMGDVYWNNRRLFQ